MIAKRLKIRTGALLAAAAAGLLLLAIGLYWFHQRGQAELLRRLTECQAKLGFEIAGEIEGVLQHVHDGLHHLAQGGDSLLDSPQMAQRQLEALFHGLPHGLLHSIYLRDSSGNLLAAYPAGRLAASFPVHLLTQTSPFTPVSRLIRLEDDCLLQVPHPLSPGTRPQAELVALVSLTGLRELCLPPEMRKGFFFLLDEKGEFLLHSKPEMAGRPFNQVVSPRRQPEFYDLLRAMMRGERGSGVFYEKPEPSAEASGESDHKVLLAYAPLHLFGNQWSLAFALPAELVDDVDLGNSAFMILLVCGFGLAALPLISLHRLIDRGRQARRDRDRLAAEHADLGRSCEIARLRSRQLLDNAGDAIFFIDPDDGSLLEINRRTEELLGYTAAEIHTLSLSVLFPGRQRRRYLRLVKNVLDKGYGENDDLLFRRKDGRLFTGAIHARLGELGERRVVHGVLRDVSEIRRIEQELRQKNQDLTLVNEIARQVSGNLNLNEMLREVLARTVQAFAAAGGGIYLTDEDSSSLHMVVHQGVDAALLADIGQITPGVGLAGRVAATGQARTSADLQQDRRIRSQAVREAGWHAAQAIPLVAKQSTIGVLLLFSLDKRIMGREELNLLLSIGRQVGTAVQAARLFEALQWQNRLTRASNRELKQSRRKLEANVARLEEINRALERLDRTKSNFLAMASHELRTPLTYVLSGAELLRSTTEERLGSEEKRMLEAIHQGGKRLESIVQDLLEAARIESQSLYLAREEIDLPAILQGIGQEFRSVFEERRLTYRVDDFPAPLELYGDAHHLRNTFHRLLENAVKFTPEGGKIEVRAALRTPAELKRHEATLRSFSPSFFHNLRADRLLQVTVSDSGVGIDPEEHVRVFDKFYEIGQITEHFTSRTRFGGKGVGLGLSLVKGMVEAHGGMVWVESGGTGRDACGSTFHVLLPLAAAAMEVVDAAG